MRRLGLLSSVASALVVAACSSDDSSNPDSGQDAATNDVNVVDATKDTSSTDGDVDSGKKPTIVYVQSNDPTAGNNGVYAYTQGTDGSLTALAGSPFKTGGTGVSNPTQGLGPDDTDQELVLSADKKFLFVVNGGSNTIAVMSVADDGSLTPISGSPFASGGIDPSSVGLAGSFLYAVNQAQDPLQDAGAGSPNYTGFNVASSGALTPIANSTMAAGASPQIALTSADGKLLFGLDFMAPLTPSPAGPLRAFAIQANGTLVAAPNTPMFIPIVDGGTPPGTPAALGLALHPTQKVLYVGFVLRSQIGVYSYDGNSGALTYVSEASVSGKAPCWIRANADGSRLYVTDTADDSVSVMDSSNAMSIMETQHLVLKDTGPISDSGVAESQTYEETISPDGKYLFVISQRTSLDSNVTGGNVLHVLSIDSSGKLSETVPDVALPAPLGARPQGVAVR